MTEIIFPISNGFLIKTDFKSRLQSTVYNIIEILILFILITFSPILSIFFSGQNVINQNGKSNLIIINITRTFIQTVLILFFIWSIVFLVEKYTVLILFDTNEVIIDHKFSFIQISKIDIPFSYLVNYEITYSEIDKRPAKLVIKTNSTFLKEIVIWHYTKHQKNKFNQLNLLNERLDMASLNLIESNSYNLTPHAENIDNMWNSNKKALIHFFNILLVLNSIIIILIMLVITITFIIDNLIIFIFGNLFIISIIFVILLYYTKSIIPSLNTTKINFYSNKEIIKYFWSNENREDLSIVGTFLIIIIVSLIIATIYALIYLY